MSGFVEDEVEHATTRLNFSEGGRFFIRSACDEQVSVEAVWAGQRGNSDAGARDGEGVTVMVAIFHRKREGREPVLQSNPFGSELIQGNGVAEGGLSGMWRPGEEALSCVMVPIDAWVREAGETGDESALWLEQVEVRAPWRSCFGKEKLRHHAERHVDGNKALWDGSVCGPSQGREREKRSRGANELTACGVKMHGVKGFLE